jgi:hypothetical protein
LDRCWIVANENWNVCYRFAYSRAQQYACDDTYYLQGDAVLLASNLPARLPMIVVRLYAATTFQLVA